MDHPTRPPRSFHLLRNLIYVLGGLGLLLGAVFVFLNSKGFRSRLEQRVRLGMEDLTGGRVDMTGFRFRPLILQVRIEGLVIHGTERAGEPPLFEARHVLVEISPTALVRQRLMLRSVQWGSAEIHLVTKPDGSTNVPGPRFSLRSDEALAQLLDLSIHDLAMAHTGLFWNNQEIPLEMTAKDVGLNLRMGRGPRYLGTLACSDISMDAPRWSLPSSTMTAQFELAHASVKISSLLWRSPGLSGQGALDFEVLSAPAAEATFQVNGDAKELAKYLRLTNVESGEIRLEGQAGYHDGEWGSSGRIRAHQLAAKALPINPGRMDGSAEYSVDQQEARVSRILVSALGGTISGDGEARLAGPQPEFRLRTRLEGLDLTTAFNAIPAFSQMRQFSRLGARISGTNESSWTGNFGRFRSKFDMQFRPEAGTLSARFPAAGYARGNLTLNPNLGLELTAMQLETAHSRFEMHGTFSAADSNLAVDLSTTDFEESRPLVEYLAGVEEPIPTRLESAASFTGTFSGPAAARELQGRLKAGPFDFRGAHWSELETGVLARAGLFEMLDGRLKGGSSAVTFRLDTSLSDWTWSPSTSINLQARAESADIQDLEGVVGVSYPVTGLVTGRLDLTGPLSDLAGGGEFKIGQGTFAQFRFDSLSSGVEIGHSELRFKDVRVLAGHGNASGTVSYDFAGKVLAVDMHGRDFSLAELTASVNPPAEASAAPEVEGVAAFDVQGRGVPPDLKLTAAWKLDGFKLAGSPLGDLSGQLDWQGDQVRVEGREETAAGKLTLHAQAETRGDWPVELTGEFTQFDAEPWIRSLVSGRFNAQVIAGGSFRVRGPLRRPEELQADSRVEALAVHVADLTWTSPQPLELTYARKRLSAARFQMLGPSTALEVAGSVEFGHPPALDFTAEGRADAKLLDLLDPALQATGLSRLTIRVRGSPASPLLQGKLDVEGLSLAYGNLPFRISDMSGSIALQGDRATATALKGRSGGGYVTLSGSVTFAGKPRFEIQTALDQVRVRYPFEFTSLLEGNLRLAGTTDNGSLRGELRVRQMFAGESFNVLTLLSQGPGGLGVSPEGVASPLASRMRLNVDVSSAPAVRLETSQLRLAADLELRLQGTLARPVEVGSIHILSGDAIVRGNRYKVNRGDITMADPLRTRPVVDLEATTRIEQYDLTLDLSGPLDQVKIAYRSEPPLPVGDILSLLALGYVHEQEEMSTAPSERVPTVGASALLSEALSSQMTGRIQRLFGVSRVKIDPNVGGPTNVSGARVTVEQEVTRNLTLTYITSTATSQQRVIQFEWAFSENISLVGVRDQNGIFGLELKFRRRFK